MGQFASRHYDGDPYIELMRALPDRELIWWVQKVIWLAEGLTIADHFGRTYPHLFLHKCTTCNGAGSMICQQCKGYKLKAGARGGSGIGSFRLSEMAGPRRTLAAAGSKECQHCGSYCDWDDESEWEEKWSTWESRLAYYDRTYGKLMDEWYEDVINEGNLDMDTPHEEVEAPGPEETGPLAQAERQLARQKKMMGALMRRFGGHPYERGDMIDFKTVDPSRSLLENMQALGYNHNELPPELNPVAFPELMATPNSPLFEFDQQIRMEALLSRNMEAAIQDKPKPYMLEPTAGTVPCPDCQGTPWYFSVAPNFSKLMGTEESFWMRTVSRMSRYSLHPEEQAAATSRHFLEYPQQPAAAALATEPLELHLEIEAAKPRLRGAGWRAVARGASPALVARAAGAQEPLLRGGGQGDAERERLRRRAAAARGWWVVPGEPHPAYGSDDPLSQDEAKALPTEELEQNEWFRNPLDGASPLERGGAWAAQAAMPGRRLAAKIRARRLERGVEGSNLEEPLKDYNRRRGLASGEEDDTSEQQQQRQGGGGNGNGGGARRAEAALVADGSAAGRRQ